MAAATPSAAASPARAPPLHIVIASLGTRGDTQPFAALGLHLQRRGHRVTLATEARMEAFVRGLGLGWARIAGDSVGAMLQPDFFELMAADARWIGVLGAFLKQKARWERKQELEGVAKADVLRSYEAALAGADVVVSGTFTTMATFCVAESTGARWVPIVLQSLFSPTAEYANALTGPLGLGCRCLNKFTHNLMLQAAWDDERAEVQKWREEALSLAPVRDALGVFGIIHLLGVPLIVACSSLCFGPRRAVPDDISRGTEVGGFIFMPSDDNRQVDQRATAFLARAKADGAPVVYIGFGSMAAKPAALLAMAAEICTRARCRAVIVAGWTQLDVAAVGGSDDILIVGDVPHDWLFPRVRCVVHHAGIGTMAAALRAGVPQVPMPFIIDQPMNAALLVRLGVAPAAVPLVGATGASVAAAVARALDEKQPFAAAARRVGDFVRAESAGALDRYANIIEGARTWSEDSLPVTN